MENKVYMDKLDKKIQDIIYMIKNFDEKGDSFDVTDIKALKITPKILKKNKTSNVPFNNAIEGMVQISNKPCYTVEDLDEFNELRNIILTLINDHYAILESESEDEW